MQLMANRILYIAAISFLSLWPLRAGADETIECLAIGYSWSGSYEETVNINKTPIPQSFIEKNETTDFCERWSFNSASLLTWHYFYGSEKSSLAARQYLNKAKRSYNKVYRKWLKRLQQAKIDLLSSSPGRISLYNTISNVDDLSSHDQLDFAELFSSPKWLRIADQSISLFQRQVDAVEDITKDLTIDQLGGSYHVRQSLRYSLARAKARSAMLYQYLEGGDASVDIQTHLHAAKDPAFELFLEDANSSRIISCDGDLYPEDSEIDMQIVCARIENNGSRQLYHEALQYYALVYRAAILNARSTAVLMNEENNRDSLKRAKWDYSTALQAARALSTIEGGDQEIHELSYAMLQDALIALWAPSLEVCEAYRQGQHDKKSMIPHYLEKLTKALRFIPAEEWPTLWRRVAKRYLDVGRCFEKVQKIRDGSVRKEFILRRQFINAQLKSLTSAYADQFAEQ